FRRGDANQDGHLDLSDVVKVVSVLFLGDPLPGCETAMDLNADGQVDISDAIYGLSFLFAGGPAPPAPFPDCGTGDAGGLLPCVSYSQCCLSAAVDVVAIAVSNTDGMPPSKGDALRVTVTLRNKEQRTGSVSVTPRLRSKRFHDFIAVPLG